MLVVKVFVNYKEIDEIRVRNTGMKTPSGDNIYEIQKPEEMENARISHNRVDGYRPLLVKVLLLINNQMNNPALQNWADRIAIYPIRQNKETKNE